jgi:ATP-dependent Clp protease ATP-binding subunit ClpA
LLFGKLAKGGVVKVGVDDDGKLSFIIESTPGKAEKEKVPELVE